MDVARRPCGSADARYATHTHRLHATDIFAPSDAHSDAEERQDDQTDSAAAGAPLAVAVQVWAAFAVAGFGVLTTRVAAIDDVNLRYERIAVSLKGESERVRGRDIRAVA